tara:strand:- start:23301 stop:24425 length:1125 start_codon:yes stop_codon:yes gene_type:complete
MKTFDVPMKVRKEAERGLKLRKETGRGGLSTQEAGKLGIGSGVQRASDLKSGSVSYKTVRRMLAFFRRHEAYKKHHTTNPPSNSYISWLLWGGDAGYAWAKRTVAQEEKVKKGSFLALSLFGEEYPEEEKTGGFLDLVRKSREHTLELELEPEPEPELEFDVVINDPIMSVIKKGLKVRKKTEFTLAKNIGQAIRRGHFDKLDLEDIEKCLDGMGTEEGAIEASLVGAHCMLEAIEKAKPKVPAKYLEGLTGKERAKRKKEIQERMRGKQSFKPLTGDDRKTKPSKYSKTKIASEIREEIKGKGKDEFLRASAKVSGVSKRILEQVYDRGLKAWATSGHRVGATAQQWAKARVYSFLSGGKTTKTADKDLFEKI